jgi:hypothetical protein
MGGAGNPMLHCALRDYHWIRAKRLAGRRYDKISFKNHPNDQEVCANASPRDLCKTFCFVFCATFQPIFSQIGRSVCFF